MGSQRGLPGRSAFIQYVFFEACYMQALRLVWERQGPERVLGPKEEQERLRWFQRVSREWVAQKGKKAWLRTSCGCGIVITSHCQARKWRWGLHSSSVGGLGFESSLQMPNSAPLWCAQTSLHPWGSGVGTVSRMAHSLPSLLARTL